MAHTLPEQIELKHKFNKLITTGYSNKNPNYDASGYDDEDRTFKASRKRSVWTSIDGQILDKPIQVYRMWYRFLQLALELEEKKVKIVTKMQSIPLKKPKKDQWGKLRFSEMKPQTKNVKVNRKLYAEWDIDIISTTSFDDWWKGNSKKKVSAHKQLFYPDVSIKHLKDKSEWVNTNTQNYSYYRIDNRRRVNDVIADFRRELMKQPSERRPVSTADYQVFGTPNLNTLINRYNALIMQLTTTLQDDVILLSEIFRKTQEKMGDPDFGNYAYTFGKHSPGRTMRDLILPAKIALLSVCDGAFVKNPNKDYINTK